MMVWHHVLASVVAVPMAARLSNRHGRKLVYLVSVGVFVVASLACAWAPPCPRPALRRSATRTPRASWPV